MKVPATTSPLAKGIRTTEGILTTILTIAITVATAIKPQYLSHQEAGILDTVLVGLYTVQRGLIKVKALNTGPVTPLDLSGLEGKIASAVGVAVPTDDEFKQWINDAVKLGNSVTNTSPQSTTPAS